MPKESNLLVSATQSESAQIIRQRELAGWRVFSFPNSLKSRDDFFEAVRTTFPLDPPLQSNRSWDALSDSLWGGIDSLADREILIVWPNSTAMKEFAPDQFAVALGVLMDLAKSVSSEVMTCGAPKSIVVLLVS